MSTAKFDAEKHLDNRAATDDVVDQVGAKKDSNRRYLDASPSKRRALNLNRRDANRERRIGLQHHYRGFSRRDTIDRRESIEDRRE